ncbi:hypothetical protein Tco_0064235 [Tanacetum coccineum]
MYVLTMPMPELLEDDTNVESAKELQDSLESKYMVEDASSKKFLVDAVAWWIDFGATTHVCKYIAGLRHMNGWKIDLSFTWAMII